MGARSKLSAEKRAQIVALSEAGFYKRRIGADLQYNQAVVGDAIRRSVKRAPTRTDPILDGLLVRHQPRTGS